MTDKLQDEVTAKYTDIPTSLIHKGVEPAGSEGKESYRVPLKVRYDLIPPIFLWRLAAIFEEGAQKYGPNAYLEKPLPYSSIVNHMQNHLMLYWQGDRSEDHLAKIAWGVAAMMALDIENQKMNNLTSTGIKHD